MDEKIYVLGHKNPDTDSICAAIAYSVYKRKLGIENIYPRRLGEMNKETKFVLDYFGVEVPEYIANVKTQIKDADIDRVTPISPNISIRKAWNIMKKQNVKTLPVVNGSGGLVGICTLSDLTNNSMDVSTNNQFAQSKTSLTNILETLSAKVLTKHGFDLYNVNKIITAVQGAEDMGRRVQEGDIVIVGDRKDIHRAAIEKGAICLIVTDNHKVDDGIIRLAEDRGSMIISVSHDAFTTSRLINQSIPVSYVMTTKDIISFDIDDFIDEIKDIMLQTRYKSYPVMAGDKVAGTISRYHLIKSNRKKVILVDHNERSQAVDGLEQAEVIEIIDHHRIGDVQTSNPVFFYNRPLGSTSTIIGNFFLENNVPIPKEIGGILCAAIISDTLMFKSPTSTKMDEIVAQKLSDIAGIDIYEFGPIMFKAGTSLSGKTPEEIFYQDFKEFSFGKSKIGISQVYTMDIQSINPVKNNLLSFMEDICISKGYDIVMLMLTDIINDGSEILFTGRKKDAVFRAFDIDPHKVEIYLPKVVSRKKQVIPPIAQELNK